MENMEDKFKALFDTVNDKLSKQAEKSDQVNEKLDAIVTAVKLEFGSMKKSQQENFEEVNENFDGVKEKIYEVQGNFLDLKQNLEDLKQNNNEKFDLVIQALNRIQGIMGTAQTNLSEDE